MLIDIRDKILSRYGRVSFTRAELSLILGIYGDRVQHGVWRDYAIDFNKEYAVFSIYRSSKELPLYSVVKLSNKSKNKPSSFELRSVDKVLKQSTSLSEIIDFLQGIS